MSLSEAKIEQSGKSINSDIQKEDDGINSFNSMPILANIIAIFSFWDEIDKDANSKSICYNGADENHPDY